MNFLLRNLQKEHSGEVTFPHIKSILLVDVI